LLQGIGEGPEWNSGLVKPAWWQARAQSSGLVGAGRMHLPRALWGSFSGFRQWQQKNTGEPTWWAWVMLWMMGTVHSRVPPTTAPRRSMSRREIRRCWRCLLAPSDISLSRSLAHRHG
jgi:hypothetical protein